MFKFRRLIDGLQMQLNSESHFNQFSSDFVRLFLNTPTFSWHSDFIEQRRDPVIAPLRPLRSISRAEKHM